MNFLQKKLLVMADYWMGYEITKFLKENNENIVGFVCHSPHTIKHPLRLGWTEKIIDMLDLTSDKIFEWKDLKQGLRIDELKKLEPDYILTLYFEGILQPEIIQIANVACMNLHSAYLPYNRGKNPNIWAITEETPAGATLHYIDEGIDTGDIISQVKVEIEPVDTGETLYHKINIAAVELFKQTWPKIKNGTAPRFHQNSSSPTMHYAKDLKKLDRIELNKVYTAKSLIDILRARTFSPFPSAYFYDDQKRKVNIRVQLKYDKEST